MRTGIFKVKFIAAVIMAAAVLCAVGVNADSGDSRSRRISDMYNAISDVDAFNAGMRIERDEYALNTTVGDFLARFPDAVWTGWSAFDVNDAMRTDFIDALEDLIGMFDLEGKSDYRKARTIYDWICSNITYDYDTLNDSGYMLKYTAYAALMNRTAVCNGYAELFYCLAHEAGLNVKFISGSVTYSDAGHAWNIVEIDGAYYCVDSTWDAGNREWGYYYFLRCEEYFPDHIPYAEYDSTEFRNKYPMSDKDYDISKVSESSGRCGNGLLWALDNGVLSVTGEGDMWNFTTPWEERKGDITGLVLEEGITSVADYSFYAYVKLEGNLTIPYGVTYIGDSAFYGCSGLTGNLVIPGSVTRIGEYAFFGCTGLNGTLELSGGAAEIGSWAFGCCGFTGNLVIPDSVTFIDEYAFSDCCGFNGSLSISKNMTSISSGTFYNCCNLTGTIDIPDGIDAIGAAAFYRCSGFTGDLIIPDSVESVEYYAFYDCWGMSGILILGSKLDSIGYYALNLGCNEKVIVSEKVPSICDQHIFTDSAVIYYTSECGSWINAVSGGVWTTSCGEQYAAKVFDGNILESGSCGINLNWKYDISGLLTIYGSGEMYDYENASLAPWNGLTASKVKIEDGVKK